MRRLGSFVRFQAGRIRNARTDANRRNARRSTGPKSAAGKAKVAKNALRHGLAVSPRLYQTLNWDIEELAALIAGKGASSHRLECARRIAEAQIDLRRIRQVRISMWSRWKVGDTKSSDASGPAPALSGADMDMNALMKQLLRLDRYERRALSRRKAAIRDIQQLPPARGLNI